MIWASHLRISLKATLTCETRPLVPGDYSCFLIYPGPYDIPDGDFQPGDARIWYGAAKSNEVEAHLD